MDAIILFYYTLLLMLAVIMTAATCMASYLVSRSRALLFACLSFLFYFFDVAIVFKDDFLVQRGLMEVGSPFFIGSPASAIVFGWGILTFLWLAMCEYIEVKSAALRFAPGAVFVATSVTVLVFVPVGNVQMFVFYSLRELFVFWMLVYAAVRCLSFGKDRRTRLLRFRRFYAALWILTALVVLENGVVLFAVGPDGPHNGLLPFLPERNFAENLLALFCAFVACRASWRNLSIRHEEPPMRTGKPMEAFVDQNMAGYAASRKLSKREAEVMRLLLLGKDNQNIAAALQLAPGTVKVHVHHILQKTEAANRQELARDFWGFS